MGFLDHLSLFTTQQVLGGEKTLWHHGGRWWLQAIHTKLFLLHLQKKYSRFYCYDYSLHWGSSEHFWQQTGSNCEIITMFTRTFVFSIFLNRDIQDGFGSEWGWSVHCTTIIRRQQSRWFTVAMIKVILFLLKTVFFLMSNRWFSDAPSHKTAALFRCVWISVQLDSFGDALKNPAVFQTLLRGWWLRGIIGMRSVVSGRDTVRQIQLNSSG